jgi:hypothetical protein
MWIILQRRKEKNEEDSYRSLFISHYDEIFNSRQLTLRKRNIINKP